MLLPLLTTQVYAPASAIVTLQSCRKDLLNGLETKTAFSWVMVALGEELITSIPLYIQVMLELGSPYPAQARKAVSPSIREVAGEVATMAATLRKKNQK